ncbi:MAG: XdhC family protein [Prolixibacteraceae bacterium]|jgi:xanthine dehydrogenase accessory factor
MQKSTFHYTELLEFLSETEPGVLATVIRTHGSTPQKAGNSALFGSGKLLAGTIGGGITESKLVRESVVLLKSKKSKLFSFDLHGEIAKDSDSICGGGMTIFLDANPEKHEETFVQLKESLEKRICGVLITWIDQSNPEEIETRRYWITKDKELFFPGELGLAVDVVLSEMLENQQAICRNIEVLNPETGSNILVFFECIVPKPSLFIAGAGHIGRALAHLCKFLDFEVIVWDDRAEFADKAQITDADLVLTGSIDLAMEHSSFRTDSYLVIVTRGHKNDAEVLRKFISKPSAYLGMIGSQRKVALMRASFLENKWATPAEWERVFAPVGLNIGAQTVEEIALSIAAQLLKVRNQKKRING